MADSKPKARRVPPTPEEKAEMEKAQHRRFLEGAREAGVPDELSESFEGTLGRLVPPKARPTSFLSPEAFARGVDYVRSKYAGTDFQVEVGLSGHEGDRRSPK